MACPVYERAWVLEQWFDHLDSWPLHLSFVFAWTPGQDRTLDIIQERAASAHIIIADEGDHSTERDWGKRTRIETLADMRNALLAYARDVQPAFYFSLDSDVLVAPWEYSKRLFDTSFDAVAPLVYLGSGDTSNAFYWRGDGHISRVHKERHYAAQQRVDVIAAAVLMKPAAYNFGSYSYDMLGEDIAWAKSVRDQVKVGFDSSVVYKHIMDPDKLHVKDVRVPW